MTAGFRDIPKVDDVLGSADAVAALASIPRALLVDAIRLETESLRARITAGTCEGVDFSIGAVAARAVRSAGAACAQSLVPVLNATGVLLHTNLGRAPLARAALERATALCAGYSNLEYDLEARERGDRYSHCEGALSRLTGAEAALVVNNNAAAVVLILAAFARGRQAVVSRGELIEIGGSFRLPEVFAQAGVQLVEVGTTNRTYLRDYATAIGPETALLLKAHRSNFDVTGFTAEVGMRELAELGRARGVTTAYDAGAGCLVDLREFGLSADTVPESIASGVDLVAFSGDKLLGGPQAGIITGRARLVSELRRHPLLRAFRVDKLTLATLEATLSLYENGRWRSEVPLFALLGASVEALAARAVALCDGIRGAGVDASVVATLGRVGGGTLPSAELPGRAVRVTHPDVSAVLLDERLRRGSPAVLGRLEGGALLLDLRAIPPESDSDLQAAVVRASRTEPD